MINKNKQAGTTLMELTVVLLILIALAGLALPYVSGTSSSGLCNATDVTMQNSKSAIMEGFYIDTLGYFPKKTKDTSTLDFNLTYLFEKSTESGWNTFDPESRIGWKGPYLTAGRKLDILSTLDASFQSASFVHAAGALTSSDFAVFDAWNRPLIIQQYDEPNNGFRLISAGENGELETTLSGSRAGDDRVIYLNKPAPESNDSCG